MTRYLALALAIPLAGLLLMCIFNVVVDPFDIYRIVAIESVNATKPVRDSNGARVTVSHDILRGGYRAIFVGNSRIEVGFPKALPEISGGVLNAGMAGANALEMARAAALARRTAGVDCIFISLDFASFNAVGNKTGGYLESALPDGSRWRSWLETAFAYPTLVASINTVSANLLGGQLADLTAAPVEARPARAKFETSARAAFAFYRGFEYDRDRLNLVIRVIDLMTAKGIQAIVFFPPTHAWNEEAIWGAGRAQTYLQFRRDSLAALDRLATRPARAPCDENAKAISTWDFSGFRKPALTAVPSAEVRGVTSPFMETQHFNETLGRAMLLRMLGREARSPWSGDQIGERIDSATVAQADRDLERRRREWLRSSPDARALSTLVAEWRAKDNPAPPSDRSFLTPADFAGL